MNYLFLDTETTGLVPKGKHWKADFEDFPHLVQVAWAIYTDKQKLLYESSSIIKPEGWTIPKVCVDIHGISTKHANETGFNQKVVLRHLMLDAIKCEKIIGYNLYFDISIIKANLLRLKADPAIFNKYLDKDKRIDPMKYGAEAIPDNNDKWLKLTYLYKYLFDEEMPGAHDALNDVTGTARVYFELVKRGIIK